MKQPYKISVIIPTRNRKELVSNALGSVLQQTYSNLEVIVHDNNSQDGTESHIKELALDPRVQYYKVDHDLSMVENWNKAYSYASGDYVVRLDDDNVFFPDFIENSVRHIVENNLDISIAFPLVIRGNHDQEIFFTPSPEVHKLNKFHLAYLTLTASIDSNYSIYKRILVNKLFPDGEVYQTTLPDRFMDLCISDHLEDLQLSIGLRTEIVAITRFDYQIKSKMNSSPMEYPDFHTLLESSDFYADLQKYDCHGNFAAHIIACANLFKARAQDAKLKQFIDKYIFAPEHYSTNLQINYLSQINSVTSLQELLVVIKLLSGILFKVFCFPCEYSYGKPMLKRLVYLASFALRKVLTLSINQGRIENADKWGNDLSELILAKQHQGHIKEDRCLEGNINFLLERIDRLSSKI